MYSENRKHKGIYHRPLNSIIPGILPPTNPQPDALETVHFIDIYNNFDPNSLTHEQVIAIAQDSPMVSGADIGDTYTLDGVTYPIPAPPLKERLNWLRKDVENDPSYISRYEKIWRKKGTRDSYRNVRQALGSAIRSKVLLQILEMQEKTMLPSERNTEYEDYKRYESASHAEMERMLREKYGYKSDEMNTAHKRPCEDQPHRSIHERYPFRWKARS